MKKETAERLIEEIDPAYIEEYAAMQDALYAQSIPRRGLRWGRLVPIAATLAALLLVGGLFLMPALRRGEDPALPPVETLGELTENSTGADTGGTHPPVPDTTEETLPENITLLSPEMVQSGILSGTAVKEVGDANAGQLSDASEMVPPHFPIAEKALNLTARATEVLPHIYETLPAYASVRTRQYRIIKMTVLDPLDSGMSGEFYYAMPLSDYVDVLRYDALLISIEPAQNSLYHDLATGELTTFSAIFTDVWDMPQYWHMLPFSDGVFDESIFESYEGEYFDEWLFHYRNYTNGHTDQLDPAVERKDDWSKYLLVYHASTYEETIATYKSLRAEYLSRPYVDEADYALSIDTGFTSPEALEAMAYVESHESGTFNDTMSGGYFFARRYINGCPTNEYILISNINTPDGAEEVLHRNRFEDSDMEDLPDVAGYVASLDLDSMTPPHTDMSLVGERLYCSAAGWYQKTADGVECFVKIYWLYRVADEEDYAFMEDDAYIRLTADGATFLSREEVEALIGDSSYISRFPYNEKFSFDV